MTGPDRTSPGAPDAFELELLRLDAIDDPERAARIETAASGALAAVDDELAAYAAYWAVHRPPLPLPEPTSRGRGAWLALPLLAALVLLSLRVLVVPPGEQDGVRPMGGLPVSVIVTRDGERTPWTPGDVHAGDRLHLALTPPDDGYLEVGTVEAHGHVSLLMVGEPVRKGERFVLAGAVELDQTDQEEWLVVQLVDRPRTPGDAQQAFRELLPYPTLWTSHDRWVGEVTRTP